jgi:hypothetical protein
MSLVSGIISLPLLKFFHWFDRNNWTPEMWALVRPDGDRREATGSAKFDIYAATAYRNIPRGHKLATFPADSLEDAIAYWAGETPYERVAENRIRFRHRDEFVVVPEGEQVSF